MKTTKRRLSFVALLLCVLLIAAAVCTSCAPKLTDLGATVGAEHEVGEGAKTITLTVINGANEATVYTVHTDAEYLRGAIEPHGLVGGREDLYGMWVTTVDGILADESKQEWWQLFEGTEQANYGVDTLKIKDGGSYTYVLTVGW